MIIAVDFDGTIVSHAFPDIGEVRPNCKNVLQRIRDAGHKIIIWTCRSNDDWGDFLTPMKEWLDQNEIPYDAINENLTEEFHPKPKIYYDLLIDDRALGRSNPVKWSLVEFELEKLDII